MRLRQTTTLQHHCESVPSPCAKFRVATGQSRHCESHCAPVWRAQRNSPPSRFFDSVRKGRMPARKMRNIWLGYSCELRFSLDQRSWNCAELEHSATTVSLSSKTSSLVAPLCGWERQGPGQCSSAGHTSCRARLTMPVPSVDCSRGCASRGFSARVCVY
jgi:hypothetical protein